MADTYCVSERKYTGNVNPKIYKTKKVVMLSKALAHLVAIKNPDSLNVRMPRAFFPMHKPLAFTWRSTTIL